MLDWPISTVALLTVIVLAAATVKGTTAFGFNITSIPLMLLLLGPTEVVAIVVPLAVALNISIVVQTWKQAQWGLILPIAIAAIAGVPLGNYVLLAVPEKALRILIASLVLAMALLLTLGFRRKIRRERLAAGVVGLTGGFLATSTATPAPPIALFLMSQGVEAGSFRASMASMLLIVSSMGMVSLVISGAITGRTLLLDLVLLPTALLGSVLAQRLLSRVNLLWFNRFVLLIIIVGAISAIASAVVKLV